MILLIKELLQRLNIGALKTAMAKSWECPERELRGRENKSKTSSSVDVFIGDIASLINTKITI